MISRPLPVFAGARIPHPLPALFHAPLGTNQADIITPLATPTVTSSGQITYGANGATMATLPSGSAGIAWAAVPGKFELSSAVYNGKRLKFVTFVTPGSVLGFGGITNITLFTFTTGSDKIGFYYQVRASSIHLLAFKLSDSTSVDLGAFLTNVLYNIAFVFNTDLTTVSFYVNGALLASIPFVRNNGTLSIVAQQSGGQGFTSLTFKDTEMFAL